MLTEQRLRISSRSLVCSSWRLASRLIRGNGPPRRGRMGDVVDTGNYNASNERMEKEQQEEEEEEGEEEKVNDDAEKVMQEL